ncbi:MAG: gamma-glutamyl-gamma-aminobutyrate hydrolase family protein [Patescibacteria group bacterium]
MNRPIIGVTSGEITDNDYPWAPVSHGKAHTYTDSIEHAGGIPIIIPLYADTDALRVVYELLDGLMLTGGNDLDPATYGAEPSQHTSNTKPLRDKQEIQLLQWALEDDKPVLGICRGMQIINVCLGGTLYQHISEDLPEAHEHDKSAKLEDFNHLVHELQIEPSSQLARIFGTTNVPTNGLHHQAIKDLGKGLIATAHAGDDVIEAIELPTKRFVSAAQGHPEALEAGTVPLWAKWFKAFVQSATDFSQA